MVAPEWLLVIPVVFHLIKEWTSWDSFFFTALCNDFHFSAMQALLGQKWWMEGADLASYWSHRLLGWAATSPPLLCVLTTAWKCERCSPPETHCLILLAQGFGEMIRSQLEHLLKNVGIVLSSVIRNRWKFHKRLDTNRQPDLWRDHNWYTTFHLRYQLG